MKFTYSWLKDYVDIRLKPQELAEKLTMAGLEIEALERIGDEWVFNAEVTTNRPDWLSIIGIAREVAAVTGSRFLVLGSEQKRPRTQNLKPNIVPQIQVLDAQACPRYTGRIISGVKVGPSPEWLTRRLCLIGARPVNNIVDITNFVLFETGQPLHAFDFDKLSSKKIIVRRAKDNEEIIAIDGTKKKLNPNILVIADQSRPVAIAGIMGAKVTEVTAATKNILLESAYFDPATIRRASKFLSLTSDSSYRFERKVDSEVVGPASDRATKLILELAGGSAGKFADTAKKKMPIIKVSVRPHRVNDLLGIEVPTKDIIRILKSLGLASVTTTKAKLVFSVPSWRRDLRKEIDLIEEIIRLYGYEKIPVVGPKDIETADRVFLPQRLEFQARVRDTLISFGLNEVLTYSLIDRNTDEMFKEAPCQPTISIKNPLSPQLASLRRNLTAGVLSTCRWNLNRNINDVRLFEIGPVYSSNTLNKQEPDFLAICISGSRTDNWQDGTRPADFYYLKGLVEALFAELGVSQYDIVLSAREILDSSQAAQIIVNEKTIGSLGKVKKDLLAKIDIDKDCFVCQLNLEGLASCANFKRRFSALPKFPAICRDISTLAKQDISSADIVKLINKAGAGLIKDIKLFDVYRGEQIPKGYNSLVYRLTYQSLDRTLTDTEVEAIHSKIISTLKEELSVGIR